MSKPSQINEPRSKQLRLGKLNEAIPSLERSLTNMISERAGIEAVLAKIKLHDLAKNHNGLCGIVGPPESCANESCERFYGHTGLHSWEGGGEG